MNLKKQNSVDLGGQDRVSRSKSKSTSSNNWLSGDTTTACQQRRIVIALRSGPKTTSQLHLDVGVYRVSSRISELRDKGYEILNERYNGQAEDGLWHIGMARYTLLREPLKEGSLWE